MKKITLMIVFSLLLLTACQDDSSILEPTNNYAVDDLSKGRPILNSDSDDLKIISDYVDQLDVVVQSRYSKSFVIDGAKGGRVSISYSWKDGRGAPVSLLANLTIPRGAFKGTLKFDMIFDLDNYAMELYPSPFTFDKPVEFSMYFYGVDLSQFVGSKADFNYLDSNNEVVEYRYIHTDFTNGNLIVERAMLNHFSRYGWTRTTTTK